MKNGASVTIVHEGTIAHAIVLKLSDGWWWVGATAKRPLTRTSGPLGDEGIHYVRGHLRTWWPPHRKRADALRVAAALGAPPLEPPTLKITLSTAQKLMDDMLKSINTDMNKIMGDADKMVRDAERLTYGTKRISFSIRHRVKNRRY